MDDDEIKRYYNEFYDEYVLFKILDNNKEKTFWTGLKRFIR
ncbi:hypothetical protein [uncultured Methanobrevibacter sp.]|nr:hypothetical protein [uncultured Methanobrevibacter sp.]